jgi:hypothetical protein
MHLKRGVFTVVTTEHCHADGISRFEVPASSSIRRVPADSQRMREEHGRDQEQMGWSTATGNPAPGWGKRANKVAANQLSNGKV